MSDPVATVFYTENGKMRDAVNPSDKNRVEKTITCYNLNYSWLAFWLNMLTNHPLRAQQCHRDPMGPKAP